MIKFQIGNLLSANSEALVNTVNTVGVMGKGIALQFRELFPENYKQYQAAVKRNEVLVGRMFVTELNRTDTLRYIVNFPTKQHWKNPSRLEFISEGLVDLKHFLIEKQIKSIALPPLGCGNGGLDWLVVKPMIEKTLGDLTTEIIVFEPSAEIAARLEKENGGKNIGLTKPRAMMLHLLYHYRQLGEFASEFAAEKLMYFLQRLGEPQLQLDFQRHFYGPYSGKVRHVLYALNGSYLSGLSQKANRPFDTITLDISRKEEVANFLVENTNEAEKKRLETLKALIDGFQSPAGLELLASLDFLIKEQQTFDIQQLTENLRNWSPRKKRLFTDFQINVAYQQLLEFKTSLYEA